MEMAFSNRALQASSLDADASPPLSAPAIAGEGDHWSSRSERTVVEGAPDAELRCRCKRFPSREEASEDVRTSLRLLRRVESCAPSTTLLRRVVPLPRYRGGG